jgi:hypothetical protein
MGASGFEVLLHPALYRETARTGRKRILIFRFIQIWFYGEK